MRRRSSSTGCESSCPSAAEAVIDLQREHLRRRPSSTGSVNACCEGEAADEHLRAVSERRAGVRKAGQHVLGVGCRAYAASAALVGRRPAGLFESRIARIARRQNAAIRAESRGAQ